MAANRSQNLNSEQDSNNSETAILQETPQFCHQHTTSNPGETISQHSISTNQGNESTINSNEMDKTRIIDSEQNLGSRDLEQQLSKSRRELESIVIRYAKSERDNLQRQIKIDDLDKKLKRAIKDNESLANRVKILTNDKNHLTETLSAKVAQLTVLEQKSYNANTDQSKRLEELEKEVTKMKQSNSELLRQIETHKCKEGELLDFSERLSMRQMFLESELLKALENVPDHKQQYEEISIFNKELNELNEKLTIELRNLNDRLEIEVKRVESLSKEKNELVIKCDRKIDELENDKKVMQRRHQNSMKEILKKMRHDRQRSMIKD